MVTYLSGGRIQGTSTLAGTATADKSYTDFWTQTSSGHNASNKGAAITLAGGKISATIADSDNQSDEIAYDLAVNSTVYYEQPTGRDTRTMNNGGREGMGVRISTGHYLIGKSITRFEVPIKRDQGSPTGTIEAFIRNNNGSVKATSTSDHNAAFFESNTWDDWVWIPFIFPATTIADGDILCVELDQGTTGNHQINMQTTPSNQAGLANQVLTFNSDTASDGYTDESGEELVFRAMNNPVSDTSWVLRYEVNNVSSSFGEMCWFGLCSADGKTGSGMLGGGTEQNFICHRIGASAQNLEVGAGTAMYSESGNNRSADSNDRSPVSNSFTDMATSTRYYCELKRTSATDATLTIRTTSHSGTVAGTVSITDIPSDLKGLRYIKLLDRDKHQPQAETLEIENVKFWNGSQDTTATPTYQMTINDAGVKCADTFMFTPTRGAINCRPLRPNADVHGGCSIDMLGTNVSDSAWVLRYKLTIDRVIELSDTMRFYMGMASEDSESSAGNSKDFIGFHVKVTSSSKEWRTLTANDQSMDLEGTDIGDVTTGTFYVEIIRTSTTGATVNIRTTSHTNDSGKITGDITVNSGCASLRYFYVSNVDVNGTTAAACESTIDDIEFYNGVTSTVTETDEKEAITNVPAGTRYEETDTRKIFRYGGTVAQTVMQSTGNDTGGIGTSDGWGVEFGGSSSHLGKFINKFTLYFSSSDPSQSIALSARIYDDSDTLVETSSNTINNNTLATYASGNYTACQWTFTTGRTLASGDKLVLWNPTIGLRGYQQTGVNGNEGIVEYQSGSWGSMGGSMPKSSFTTGLKWTEKGTA